MPAGLVLVCIVINLEWGQQTASLDTLDSLDSHVHRHQKAVQVDISAASLNSGMLQLGADHSSQLEPSLADGPDRQGSPIPGQDKWGRGHCL